MKRSYAEVCKDADAVTDKISTQIRTLGLGLLAFTWGALVSQAQIARDLTAARKWQLLIISLLAIVGLLADFLQYVFGYRVILAAIKRMDREKIIETTFEKSIAYRLRFFLFYLKQWIITGTTVWLLVTVLIFIVRH